MGSQVPNPFERHRKALQVKGKKVLVSGRFLNDILATAGADRVISGDNIEESPSQSGRTLAGTAAGSQFKLPFQVSSFKDDSGFWCIRIATNGGTFADVNGKPIEPPGVDDDGNIDTRFDAGNEEKFAVSFLWTYEIMTDDVEVTIEVKKYATAGEELKTVIQSISTEQMEGKSRIVLATGIGAGSGEDHVLKVEKQYVTTSIRAAWMPHYTVTTDYGGGNIESERNAAQDFQADIGRVVQ